MSNPNYYKVLEEDDNDDDDNYYNSDIIKNLACVGAGVGGRFEHSSEFKSLNFKQAISSKEKELWVKEIDKEYKRMMKYKL